MKKEYLKAGEWREEDMHEPFILADGRVLHTLHDLAHALRSMPASIFNAHVTPERNDFAIWIAHSLGLPALAEQVKQAHDPESLLAILEAYLLASQQHEQKKTPRREEEDDWVEIDDLLNETRERTAAATSAPPQPTPREAAQTPTAHAAHPLTQAQTLPHAVREATSQPSTRASSSSHQATPLPDPSSATPTAPTPTPSPQTPAATQPEAQPATPPHSHASQTLPAPPRATQAEASAHTPPTPSKSNSEGETPHADAEREGAHEASYQEEVKHYQQPLGAETISEDEVREYADILHAMRKEIAKVYIGQTDVVEKVLLALTCDAHALLEGVPGLAKSLLVETLGHIVKDASFKRIQFLPDMLPADVLGTEVFNPQTGEFRIVKGPIFANFVLADEINRAPPKTHAALMEAMQEKKVNIGDHQFILDRPFLVLATQNPLEQKGTYSLPEAVLDRFMFKIILDYPLREHEKIILTENATVKKDIFAALREVVDKETFLRLQHRVKDVYVSDRIREYILDLIEATRGKNKKIEGMKFVKYGAGPRAGIYLTIGAKARALTQGRTFVLPEDVMYVAPDILRHRIFLNYTGKAYEISTDKIVEEILLKVNPL